MSQQDPTPPDVRIDEPAPPPRLPRRVGTSRVMRRLVDADVGRGGVLLAHVEYAEFSCT